MPLETKKLARKQHAGDLHERFAPGGLRKHTSALERHAKRQRKKWKRRSEQDRPMGGKIKLKHTYRVRAYDAKDRLTFFKTRTKLPVSTIKRMLSRGKLREDRITI